MRSQKQNLLWQLLLIAMPGMGVLLLFFLVLYFFFIPEVEKTYFNQRLETVKQLTNTMVSDIENRYKETQDDLVSPQEAQNKALNRLRGLRYGSDQKDYYWISQLDGVLLMHPHRPDLEGENLKEGLVHQQIASANLENHPTGAFIEYTWQLKDKLHKQEKKISYVRLFKPWNWVIGTGVYIKDIQDSIAAIRRRFIWVGGGVALLTTTLTLFLCWKSFSAAKLSQDIMEKLSQSEEKARVTLDSIGDGVIAVDTQGFVTRMNHRAESLTGWTESEALGKPLLEVYNIINCETKKSCDTPIDTFFQADKNPELPMKTLLISRDGQEHPISDSCNLIKNVNGEVIGGVIVFHDMGESYRMQEELQYKEERFRAIFDHAHDAILVVQDGKYTECNEMALKMFACKKSELIGKTPYDLSPLEQPNGKLSKKIAECYVKRVIEEGMPENFEWKHLRLDGTPFDAEVSLNRAKLRDEVFIVALIRDVTERNELRERLLQSEKMDAIGHLAGGVAHDFNNMLGGIIGATELLETRLQKEGDPKPLIEMILESAERAADLTEKLLAFARKQPLASSPIDVNAPLLDAIALLESTVDPRIKVHSSLTHDSLRVIGAPTQLQNAFLNLLINATHAMPDGGDLYVSSRIVELNKHYCETSTFDLTPGNYAEVEIRDTGVGIAPELINHIFEPFYTTKAIQKGTGLGLAAVMGTVQQHRGAITVYSEPDVGTSFHISLPLTDLDQPSHTPVKTESSPGSGTILIIDDEEVMRATASAILEELGYTILLAKNGLEGIEVFKDHKEEIDLVILDMVMPELNGRDCFKALKEITSDVRVILSSGFSREDELQAMHDLGLKGFIRKPFRLATLSQAVKEALI